MRRAAAVALAAAGVVVLAASAQAPAGQRLGTTTFLPARGHLVAGFAVDREWLAALAERLARRMTFTLTVSEKHLYLSLGEETLSATVRRIPLQQS